MGNLGDTNQQEHLLTLLLVKLIRKKEEMRNGTKPNMSPGFANIHNVWSAFPMSHLCATMANPINDMA